jgi:uncharacterized protein (DUF427 family)
MANLPNWAKRARAMWRHTGAERPPFALAPKAGQESVWDYPRPPRVVADAREVIVRAGTVEIARTRRAVRVLETASPPAFYIPLADVQGQYLQPAPGGSHCEWKGIARYWSIVIPAGDGAPAQTFENTGWSYPNPNDLPGFEQIRDCISFYPARLACFVDGERVAPQPGRFYGGWVTPEVVGPFKGEDGSGGW